MSSSSDAVCRLRNPEVYPATAAIVLGQKLFMRERGTLPRSCTRMLIVQKKGLVTEANMARRVLPRSRDTMSCPPESVRGRIYSVELSSSMTLGQTLIIIVADSVHFVQELVSLPSVFIR